MKMTLEANFKNYSCFNKHLIELLHSCLVYATASFFFEEFCLYIFVQ